MLEAIAHGHKGGYSLLRDETAVLKHQPLKLRAVLGQTDHRVVHNVLRPLNEHVAQLGTIHGEGLKDQIRFLRLTKGHRGDYGPAYANPRDLYPSAFEFRACVDVELLEPRASQGDSAER